MDTSEYRRNYEQQLERAREERTNQRGALERPTRSKGGARVIAYAPLSDQDDVAAAIAVIRDAEEDVERRVAALSSLTSQIRTSQALTELAIGLLRESQEPPEVRLAALRLLQVASFSSAQIRSMRPEFLDALRTTLDADDQTLRQDALEILARAKDEYAQRRLLEGLQDPARALVPPEMAIRLLSYDVHAEYFPILRDIVSKPPSAVAKRAAIRALAADPASRDLLAEVLTDKRQSRPTRRASAIALQTLAPTEFEQYAREIVLDPDENEDLRATAISALTHFADQETLGKDEEFNRRVEQLQQETPVRSVKRAASTYISKRRSGDNK